MTTLCRLLARLRRPKPIDRDTEVVIPVDPYLEELK